MKILPFRRNKSRSIIADCMRARDAYQEKIEYLYDEMIWELSMRHNMTEDEIREILDEV